MADPIITPTDEDPGDDFAGDALHDLGDITEAEVAQGEEWGSEDEPDFVIVDGRKVYLDELGEDES